MSGIESACDVCGESLTQGAYFCGECGARVPEFTDSRSSAPVSESAPDPEPMPERELAPEAGTGREHEPPVESLSEQLSEPLTEPIAAPAAETTVFTLVFSTGERARVTGYGRIGRMPSPPDGVVADHLIVVNDATRTVSKNHLDLWVTPQGIEVLDLDSANGTVVSLPGIAAERLVSGTRMLIRRGTSVAIGDQSFLVE